MFLAYFHCNVGMSVWGHAMSNLYSGLCSILFYGLKCKPHRAYFSYDCMLGAKIYDGALLKVQIYVVCIVYQFLMACEMGSFDCK